jgi:hypothetical protein
MSDARDYSRFLEAVESANRVADSAASLESLVTDAVDAWNERLEKELFAAWRAGYDYLHIYRDEPEPLGREPLENTTVLGTRYVIPSRNREPMLRDHSGIQYLHTYDFETIPDHVMRAAWNDNLEKYERLTAER